MKTFYVKLEPIANLNCWLWFHAQKNGPVHLTFESEQNEMFSQRLLEGLYGTTKIRKETL